MYNITILRTRAEDIHDADIIEETHYDTIEAACDDFVRIQLDHNANEAKTLECHHERTDLGNNTFAFAEFEQLAHESTIAYDRIYYGE